VEAQFDKLVQEFVQAMRKIAVGAQNINVNINLTNTNRLSWTVTIQENGEDSYSYTKNRGLTSERTLSGNRE
jgi:hypothetical protein